MAPAIMTRAVPKRSASARRKRLRRAVQQGLNRKRQRKGLARPAIFDGDRPEKVAKRRARSVADEGDETTRYGRSVQVCASRMLGDC